jgi:rod shape-determining protein MreB
MTIGCAVPREDDISIKITGRNLITGLPTTIEVTSLEILDALKESIEQILVATRTVLEKTPPELASDISETGIVMTGGGALLYGIGESIKMSTGIDVCIAEEPLSCVAKGTGIALTELDILETGGSIKR